jgi:pentatricopeptide repeat protein
MKGVRHFPLIVSLQQRFYTAKFDVVSKFALNPNQKAASAIISRQRDLNISFKIYDILRSKEAPNTFVLSALVHTCMQSNQPTKALALWKDMKQLSVVPDAVLTKLFFEASISAGNVEMILELLEYIQGVPKTKQNVSTYLLF